MAQYIDKDALVAEIENLKNTYKKCPTHNSYEEGLKDGRLIGYKDALHKINTFEAKEVDLKEELDEWMKYGPHTDYPWCTIPDAIKITAEHFFELGLNASNPLT